MEEQNLVIRALCPELCEDWLEFFENVAFADHGEWAACYCLEGHLDPETQEKWTDAKERRERAIELIKRGQMQGYLAYLDNKVIGWCNANDRENYKYLTVMFHNIGYQLENERVKAIFCFLIAPEYRGKGVAKKLLERVCEDAMQDGYGGVEAYPFVDEKHAYQYHGAAKMYGRAGFDEIAELKYVKVMRRSFK